MVNFHNRLTEQFLSKPWVVFLSLAVGVLIVQGLRSPLSFDDAYITFRYARNISRGIGFVYNPGQRVLGTTTPLYTIVLALISFLFSPDILPQGSQVISVIADIISAWLIFRLSKSILKEKSLAFASSLIYIFQPFRTSVALGGMETSLFVMFLLLTYDRFIHKNDSFEMSIWAASAVLTRPDAMIALAPVLIGLAFRDIHRLVKFVLHVFLFISPWFVWSQLYFGNFIPHSIIAKNIAYKNPPGHALFYFLTFLGTGTSGPYMSPLFLFPGLFLGIPMMILGNLYLAKNVPEALIISLYPPIYICVMTFANPSMYFPWYFVPLVPGLLISYLAIIRFAPFGSRKVKIFSAAILPIFLIMIPQILLVKMPNWPLSRAREKAFFDLCGEFSDNDMSDKLILAPDIGVIGWCFEEVRILDPIGLVSPEAIPIIEDLPPEQLVTEKLVTEENPDFVISLDQFINPYLLDSYYFQENYEQIYEKEVDMVGEDQPLYMYARSD